MDSQEQSERESCRVIVLDRRRTHVLLVADEAGFLVLPSVEIPRWERVAENLTAALKRDWGCDAVCLFNFDNSSKDGELKGNHYEVMECWGDEGRTTEMGWKPIPSLAADSFQDAADFRMFEQCLHRLACYEHDSSSSFATRGWLAKLRDWIADVIRPLGFELTGPLRQYNASPTFSLVRFETNGPAVWFKAVGEPNQREFPITLKLAEVLPEFMPEILGTRPEWNGWLSREAEGANLGDTKEKEIDLWESAATDLARLQVESISKCESILHFSAHDLRPNALLASIDPFFDHVAPLMGQQQKVPPLPLNPQELSLLKLRIEDSLTLLEELQIPNTLGHLDLNPWNVIVSADGCIFIDWAEAYVGHPFFSFEYLLQHFRRRVGEHLAFESKLIRAYKAPWQRLLPDDRTVEALALAPLSAVFAYAAGTDTWRDEGRLRDQGVGIHFRSLARRMSREAVHFAERRSPCLS